MAESQSAPDARRKNESQTAVPQTHVDKQRDTEQSLLRLGATAQLAPLNRESVCSSLAEFDARTRRGVAPLPARLGTGETAQ